MRRSVVEDIDSQKGMEKRREEGREGGRETGEEKLTSLGRSLFSGSFCPCVHPKKG